MDDRARSRREAEILEAALAELREKGYRGTTMLAVARRAGASKETLYAWFGDKRGLFRALVAANAADIRGRLERALAGAADPRETLEALGPALLRLLLGDRAVAINRAAAADADDDANEGGGLGRALAEAGRDSVLPLIAAVLRDADARGRLRVDDPEEAAETWLGLLFGDLQIRRVIGVAALPDDTALAARATRATARLFRLYG